MPLKSETKPTKIVKSLISESNLTKVPKDKAVLSEKSQNDPEKKNVKTGYLQKDDKL